MNPNTSANKSPLSESAIWAKKRRAKNAWSDILIGHPINKARFYLTDQHGAAVDTTSD